MARRRGSSRARNGSPGAAARARPSVAGSASTATRSTRRSTALPSRAAIPAAHQAAAATAPRRRVSRTLPVLARLGARAPPPAADRHGRRPRRAPAARNFDAERLHRQELPARGRDRDPAAAPIRRERLAERPGESCPPRQGAHARPARGCTNRPERPMSWPWEVVERDHELQDPTSAEKILLLGEYLRLTRSSRVLDLACGKAGPAMMLAATFGAGSGRRDAPAVRRRGTRASRGSRTRRAGAIETADAAAVPARARGWDAALCLGASFVWGNDRRCRTRARPAVRRGGFVAIGEPFWRDSPPRSRRRRSTSTCRDRRALRVRRPRAHGPDRILRGRLGPLREPPLARARGVARRAPGARGSRAEISEPARRPRDDYIRSQRALLGWAIFVGRKG